jgi:hypothetical protein
MPPIQLDFIYFGVFEELKAEIKSHFLMENGFGSSWVV